MKNLNSKQSRRNFLKAAGASAPLLSSLSVANQVAAQTSSGGDYKALVCLFLFGGNDNGNTFIDMNQVGDYRAARGGVALSDAEILRSTANGFNIGINGALQNVHKYYEQGNAAVISNVGPLIVPTTKDQAGFGFGQSPKVPLPPQLFSHNSQQYETLRGTSSTAAPSGFGWAGKIADIMHSSYNTSDLSMNVSTNGMTLMMSGATGGPFSITPYGPIQFADMNSNIFNNLETTIKGQHFTQLGGNYNAIRAAFSERAQESITNARMADFANRAGALQLTPPENGNNTLQNSFHQAATFIANHQLSGHRRQIFFIGDGGYDFHGNIKNAQIGKFQYIDAAIGRFMETIESLGMSDQVTLFTASDFGRSFLINSSGGNSGSDHGWGGHHFVLGGAVNGSRVYGDIPEIGGPLANGPQDAGRGSLIPTTSIAQMNSTLARWFGVPDEALETLFPELTAFENSNGGYDMGFMRT